MNSSVIEFNTANKKNYRVSIFKNFLLTKHYYGFKKALIDLPFIVVIRIKRVVREKKNR